MSCSSIDPLSPSLSCWGKFLARSSSPPFPSLLRLFALVAIAFFVVVVAALFRVHSYLLTPSLSLLPVAVFVLRCLRLGQHGLSMSIGGLLWVLSCFGSGSQFTWANLVCLPSSYRHHPYGAVNGGGGGAVAAARA